MKSALLGARGYKMKKILLFLLVVCLFSVGVFAQAQTCSIPASDPVFTCQTGVSASPASPASGVQLSLGVSNWDFVYEKVYKWNPTGGTAGTGAWVEAGSLVGPSAAASQSGWVVPAQGASKAVAALALASGISADTTFAVFACNQLSASPLKYNCNGEITIGSSGVTGSGKWMLHRVTLQAPAPAPVAGGVTLGSVADSVQVGAENKYDCPAGKVACGAVQPSSTTQPSSSVLGFVKCCNPVGFTVGASTRYLLSGAPQANQDFICPGTEVLCGSSTQTAGPPADNAMYVPQCCSSTAVSIDAKRLVPAATGGITCAADEVMCGTKGWSNAGYPLYHAGAYCCKISVPASTATSCTPNWQCSDFSACSSGTQTRTCLDANSCGTTTGKPAESQSCTSTPAAKLSLAVVAQSGSVAIPACAGCGAVCDTPASGLFTCRITPTATAGHTLKIYSKMNPPNTFSTDPSKQPTATGGYPISPDWTIVDMTLVAHGTDSAPAGSRIDTVCGTGICSNTVTAPTTGSYVLEVRAKPATDTSTVAPNTLAPLPYRDAQLTGPRSSVLTWGGAASQTELISVKNTGGETWSGSAFALKATVTDPAGNVLWTGSGSFSSTVATGASVDVPVIVPRPSGLPAQTKIDIEFQMMKNGVPFGGKAFTGWMV